MPLRLLTAARVALRRQCCLFLGYNFTHDFTHNSIAYFRCAETYTLSNPGGRNAQRPSYARK